MIRSFKVANGEARFTGEIVRQGDTIIIKGAHIEGDAALREVLQQNYGAKSRPYSQADYNPRR